MSRPGMVLTAAWCSHGLARPATALLTAEVPGEAISPFVPVRLLDGPSQPMERAQPALPPPSPSPSRTVEISLPGGSVVRVD